MGGKHWCAGPEERAAASARGRADRHVADRLCGAADRSSDRVGWCRSATADEPGEDAGRVLGMAGRDPVMAAWRTRYDAVAAAEWAAATTAVATLGAIATKVAGTADSYLVAEHDATGRLSTPPTGAAGGAKDRRAPLGAPARPPPGPAG